MINICIDEVVSENKGLVLSIARRFLNRGYEYDDICQIGYMGLLKAIKAYDESYGVKLATYATPVIIGEIKMFLRNDGALKVNRRMKDISIKIRAFENTYYMERGELPGINEIMNVLNIEAEEIIEAVNIIGTVSIDNMETEKELVANTNNMEQELFLRESLSKLKEAEQKIIKFRYEMELSQTETAILMNINQVQVSRLEKKALSKLKIIMRMEFN